MKTYAFKHSAWCLASTFIPLVPVLGIEPPPDDARPPAMLEKADKQIIGQQNAAFLGIVTAPLPQMLGEHLGISPGEGVIIRTVSPGSPADKAGIAPHDVLLSIDKEPVSSPEDITAVIRSHKPGDTVPMELIQKGKSSMLEVTLVDRPADELLARDNGQMFEGLGAEHAQRLRDLMEQNLRALDPEFGGGPNFPDARQDGAFRMLRDRMNENLLDIPELKIPEGGVRQKSTIRIRDNEGSIEMLSNNGETEVTVRDNENNILWSGDWNTDEDKAAAPEEIRKRIDRIQIGNGFSFRFGN